MSGTRRPDLPAPPGPQSSAAGPNTVLLIIQILLGIFLVGTLFVLPITAAILGTTTESAEPSDTVQTSAAALFISTIIFQFVQGSFPAISSIRRNSTMKKDWRFTADLPRDIGLGVGLAVVCLLGAQVITVLVGALVGLSDTDDAGNTDILTDNEGSIWLVGIILMVVIGAPIAEELLFRGYLLRTLEESIGSVAAILLSSVLFAIPHWQPGASWQETTVLLTALGFVGLVFAVGAVVTDRLIPSMIAHALFNGAGTAITLIGVT